MTAPNTPVPGVDPDLVGTTRPEVLQLALSGHLAAAAGGEGGNITQEAAEQVVGETFEALAAQDAPQEGQTGDEGSQSPETPTEPATPPASPAPSTTSTSSTSSKAGGGSS